MTVFVVQITERFIQENELLVAANYELACKALADWCREAWLRVNIYTHPAEYELLSSNDMQAIDQYFNNYKGIRSWTITEHKVVEK